MNLESMDLILKIAGSITLMILSFILGILAFAYQKRTKAIDDTIRSVGTMEVHVAELKQLGIAAQLARHASEIATLSEQLDTLTNSVSEVARSTAQIDRSLATLAADAGHNRATIERMDRHVTDLLARKASHPPSEAV